MMTSPPAQPDALASQWLVQDIPAFIVIQELLQRVIA
jgi:hypothetical protein